MKPAYCWNCAIPFVNCARGIICFLCKAPLDPERTIVGPGAAVVALIFLFFVPGGYA